MKIWVDGCFDFFHHGHAGALKQARALGDELIVGIHTDEEILKNKGPVVMHLDEREFAVESCRWTSADVPGAPYVTDPLFMDKYGCMYVAHGDDITTDADGNDCYQAMKDAGRFLEFKRTPNISTTDLISRMLSSSTKHHAEAQYSFLAGPEAQTRFRMYATAADAKSPYAGVWALHDGEFEQFVEPAWPKNFDKIVYAEGTFDLFHCGHIEMLKGVRERAPDAMVVVGLRADAAVNKIVGDGSPVMNIFERALCVLQCKYVDGVILNVPYSTDGKKWIEQLNKVLPLPVALVAHGSKQSNSADGVSKWACATGKVLEIPSGKYKDLRTSTIVDRVLANRAQYEERQRKKGVKSVNEKEMESLEKARDKARQKEKSEA